MAIRNVRLLWLVQGLLLVVSAAPARGGERAPGQWDQAGATHYLDSRQQEWFKFGSANRGEGETKTTCVSCHSLLPYALARPALRRISGEDLPTKLEASILAQVKSRVANWDRLDTPPFQLYYDFDEDKKKQSRGTEAIFYALLLSLDDRFHGLAKPSAETKTALTNLWATQITQGEHKGSWDWLNFGTEPWESSSGRYLGASLAAIAVGTAGASAAESRDKNEPSGPRLLRDYLTTNFAAQNLHNRVWLLWASTTMEGLLTPHDKKQLVEQIFAKQQESGGWSLATLGDYKKKDVAPDIGKPDGYATGLILHVLQLAGLPKEDSHISAGLSWLRESRRGRRMARPVAQQDPRTRVAHSGQGPRGKVHVGCGNRFLRPGSLPLTGRTRSDLCWS